LDCALIQRESTTPLATKKDWKFFSPFLFIRWESVSVISADFSSS
jgi:hypothetical protein